MATVRRLSGWGVARYSVSITESVQGRKPYDSCIRLIKDAASNFGKVPRWAPTQDPHPLRSAILRAADDDFNVNGWPYGRSECSGGSAVTRLPEKPSVESSANDKGLSGSHTEEPQRATAHPP
jgi:hypothetical protein